jgi:hypothetical protein
MNSIHLVDPSWHKGTTPTKTERQFLFVFSCHRGLAPGPGAKAGYGTNGLLMLMVANAQKRS